MNVGLKAVGAEQPGAQAGRVGVAVFLGQAIELAGDQRGVQGRIGVEVEPVAAQDRLLRGGGAEGALGLLVCKVSS